MFWSYSRSSSGISVNFHYMVSSTVGRAAEGSLHGLVRDPIMAFAWGDLRKSQKKKINRDGLSPNLALNPRPPQYGVIPTQQQCSVSPPNSKCVLLHTANHQHVLVALAIIISVSISVNCHYMVSSTVGRAAKGSRHGLIRDPIMASEWGDLRKSQKKYGYGLSPNLDLNPRPPQYGVIPTQQRCSVSPPNSKRTFILDTPSLFRESGHGVVLMGMY